MTTPDPTDALRLLTSVQHLLSCKLCIWSHSERINQSASAPTLTLSRAAAALHGDSALKRGSDIILCHRLRISDRQEPCSTSFLSA